METDTVPFPVFWTTALFLPAVIPMFNGAGPESLDCRTASVETWVRLVAGCGEGGEGSSEWAGTLGNGSCDAVVGYAVRYQIQSANRKPSIPASQLAFSRIGGLFKSSPPHSP